MHLNNLNPYQRKQYDHYKEKGYPLYFIKRKGHKINRTPTGIPLNRNGKPLPQLFHKAIYGN